MASTLIIDEKTEQQYVVHQSYYTQKNLQNKKNLVGARNAFKIWISGWSPAIVHPAELIEIFSQCGKIKMLQFKHDFAFIEYEDPGSAEDAVRKFHYHPFKEKKFLVRPYNYVGRLDDRYRVGGKAGNKDKKELGERNPYKIFVSGLAKTVEAKDLEDLFGTVGDINYIQFKKDFAFIEFKDPSSSDHALSQFNNFKFMGKTLMVREYRYAGTDKRYLKGGQGPDFGRGKRFAIRPAPVEEPERYRMIIKGFDENLDKVMIENFAKQAGKLLSCNVYELNDKREAIVEYEEESDLVWALDNLNGQTFEGVELHCARKESDDDHFSKQNEYGPPPDEPSRLKMDADHYYHACRRSSSSSILQRCRSRSRSRSRHRRRHRHSHDDDDTARKIKLEERRCRRSKERRQRRKSHDYDDDDYRNRSRDRNRHHRRSKKQSSRDYDDVDDVPIKEEIKAEDRWKS